MVKIQLELKDKADMNIKIYMAKNGYNDKREAINSVLEDMKV